MDATVIPLQELVTSLSINPNGNQVVLAAKRGLFLLDLTKPFVPPIAFKHNTKWEVTDVVWNPHREHANWIASTSNQKVLIWNIDPTGSMNVASALPTHSSSAVAPPYPGSSNGSTPTPSTPATHSSKSFRTSINTPENHRLNNLSRPNPLISTASITQHQNVEIVLHNHKRAVSDFHWSPFRSEVIATCGYDNFVHVWDLRARSGSSSGSTNSDEGIHGESGAPGRSGMALVLTKPDMSFCSWTSGATAVKWNRLSEFVLASSHDTDLRVWDIRYGSKEVALISAAHMTKIYGIDWSPRNVDEIITCSQDQCVKFWNINETRKCDGTIVTSTPVWRARFTPFGNGIVTMPLRKEFDLTMWAADNLTDPVTAFTGHTDVVKEFVWRNCGDNDYQLVTFSKDQTLRLWPIDKKVQIAVGHKPRRHSSHTTLAALYASASGVEANLSSTPNTQPSILASPGIHPSPISSIHGRFNASTPTPSVGVNEIGVPIIHEPESATKSKSGGVLLSEDDGEYSEVGSYTGKSNIGMIRPGSLRSVGSGSGKNELEVELMEIANGLKVWGPTQNQNLTIDNIDFPSKVISITIRRPVFSPDAVPVHVNILFHEDPPSRNNGAPGTPQLDANKAHFHHMKKLTHFPSFEIVRSGMIPMAQRQNLSSRLHTLYVFLCAKRIPTFEPCMRFLAYDDPNAGLDQNEVGYVGGIDGLLGMGGASGGGGNSGGGGGASGGGVGAAGMAVGGSGAVVGNASNPALNRNISGLFGPTLANSGNSFDEEVGRGGLRLTELKALSFGEEDGHMVRGLKISVSSAGPGGSGAGAQPTSLASEKSVGAPLVVGSMPSTDGDRSKKAATVVAGSLEDAAYSSDDSDERLGVGGQNQGFKHTNANLGMRDVGGKPVVMKGDDTNVPFPRLCGATFSMSGQLVCFFSPLPHPAQVKYAAYSLSTRRQQPLFQTYQFTTYPRNYVMFEHFRNFLVQKSAAASSSNLSANNPNRAASALVQSAANRNYANLLGQNREDWVGDDEVDGETSLQNLFINQTRGNTHTGGVDGYVSTSDLLSRLRSHGLAKQLDNDGAVMSDLMDAVAERTTALQLAEDREKSKLTHNEISNLSRSRSNSQSKQLDSSETDHSDIQGDGSHSDPVSRSPTPNATKTVDPPRRPSIFTVGSVASMNELDDTSSSAVSLSNVASSADLDAPAITQRLTSSHRSSRARAKSMQVEGFGATSFASDASSPADRLVAIKRGSSSSADVTPASSYTASGARPKPGIGATEGSWHSGSDITTTLLRPQKRGLSGLSSGDNEGKGCGIVVFVKDIRDMLPVSANLAKDYTLMGTDPVAICSANSVIASTHNRNDLAKLWTIAGLILARVSGVSGPSIGGDPDYDSDEDSVATADFGGSAKPAIVLAPAAPSFGSKRRQTAALLSRLQGDPKGFHQNAKDSLELKKDGTFGITNVVVKSREGDTWLRADWANHPLGRGLVDKMFRYLERIGDVQSLALLSCVLSEPFGNTSYFEEIDPVTPDSTQPPPTQPPSSLPSTYQSTQSYFPHRRPTKRASTPNQGLFLGGPLDLLLTTNDSSSSPVKSVSNRHHAIARTYSGGKLVGMSAAVASNNNGGATTTAATTTGSTTTTARPIKTPGKTNNHNVSSLGSQPVIGSYMSENESGHPVFGAPPPQDDAVQDGGGDIVSGGGSGGGGGVHVVRRHQQGKRDSGSPFDSGSGGVGGAGRKWMKSPMPQRLLSGGSGSAAAAAGGGGMVGGGGGGVLDVRDFNTSAEHSGRKSMKMGLFPERMESGGREGGGGGGGGGVKAAEESQTSDYSLDLLNPSRRNVFDGYKIKYAEILFAWRLLEKRAEILKFVSPAVASSFSKESMIGTGSGGRVELGLIVSDHDGGGGGAEVRSKRNSNLVVCSVCRMPCRSLLSSCIKCGHGGHIDHIQAWFRQPDGGKNTTKECAVGDCGCKCVL